MIMIVIHQLVVMVMFNNHGDVKRRKTLAVDDELTTSAVLKIKAMPSSSEQGHGSKIT